MDYLEQVYQEARETFCAVDGQVIDKMLKGGSYLPEPDCPLPPQEPERAGLKALKSYWASMCVLSYPVQEPDNAEDWMGKAKTYQTASRWLLVYLAIMIAFSVLGCSSLLDLIGLIF